MEEIKYKSVTNNEINNNIPNLNNEFSLTSIGNVFYVFLSIQLIFGNVARYSLLGQLSLLLFMIVGLLFLLKRKYIRLNGMHITISMFIIFSLLNIWLGEVYNSVHSLSMVQTVGMNLVYGIILFSFILLTKNLYKIMKVFIFSSLISNLIILLINRESLFTSRIAFSWRETVTHNFLGIELSTIGPNGIAYYSSLSIIFLLILISKETKSKTKLMYYSSTFIMLFTIFAAGSRKGLLFLLGGIIISSLFLYKGSKKVLYILIGTLTSVLILLLTLYIPALYQIIGYRLEELLNLILGNDVSDSSVTTRMSLINYAYELFKNNPIYGYGLDAFRLMHPSTIVSDNNYLEMLVSGGIIGFIFYYAYVLWVFLIYLTTKNKSEVSKILFGLLIVTLIFEIGQVTYYHRSYTFFYSILFASLIIDRIMEKRKKV
ncbi:O-antigen ligase family protein [Alkalicoccus luteus]|uniref:O-antigen ligase family protein n=1 Tax=Alkalicoccus luteus TaxID=1237094 RepID=UPI004033CEF5